MSQWDDLPEGEWMYRPVAPTGEWGDRPELLRWAAERVNDRARGEVVEVELGERVDEPGMLAVIRFRDGSQREVGLTEHERAHLAAGLVPPELPDPGPGIDALLVARRIVGYLSRDESVATASVSGGRGGQQHVQIRLTSGAIVEVDVHPPTASKLPAVEGRT